MPATWTLEYNGITKTPAEWGLSALVLTLNSQAVDTLTFNKDDADVDGEEAFPFLSLIKLWRTDGGSPVKWFEGVVTELPRDGSPDREGHAYVVSGAWWYLDNLVFQQVWQTWNASLGALENTHKTHVFLAQRIYTDGAGVNQVEAQTTGEQIAEVVAYAADQGVPMQLDTDALPDLEVMVDEARDITCAEAIRKMLRWTPDAVTWFDYTTSPVTLRVKRRADLVDFNDNITGDNSGALSIKARPDLQRPAVVLKFEATNETNGISRTIETVDKWPTSATGRELRALTATINLQGFSQSYAYLDLVCSDVNAAHGADALRLAWWQNKFPWLKTVTALEIPVASVTRQTALPREAMSDVANWMNATTYEEEIYCEATYESGDGSVETKTLTAKIRATNATTGRYSSLTAYSEGEPVPTGLARKVYEAVSFLQYEGTRLLEEAEVTFAARPGMALNIAGGKAEWATMRAIIWSATYDLDNGRSTFQFGPASNLGVPDLVELLRTTRERFIYTASSTRATAQTGGSGSLSLPDEPPLEQANSGGSQYHDIVVKEKDDGSGVQGVVRIQASEAYDSGTPPIARPLTIREIDVCSDGVMKKMLVVCSEPYTLP